MSATMEEVVVVVQKTAEELRREIDELQRQQREITERLRDPRGLRKNGPPGGNARNFGANGPHQVGRNIIPPRGIIRRGEGFDAEEQPPTKKRLLSAVVKVDEEEKGLETEKVKEAVEEDQHDKDDADEETDVADRRPTLQRNYNADDTRPLASADPRSRAHNDSIVPNARGLNNARPRPGVSGGEQKRYPRERGFLVRVSNPIGQHDQDAQPAEPLPRVLPEIKDPNVAKRNRRMFGSLLGTLEKFRQEDKKLSSSDSFQRRSDQLKRAEQKAQEESERLRQQEREALAEKRRADLTLRAKLAAEADVKQLELLFIQWTEHHTRLCTFLRTKAEPAIYFMPVKPSEETDKLLQEAQQDLEEWKAKCRGDLNEYQKKMTEDSMASMDAELERWKNGPSGRSNNTANIASAEGDGERQGGDAVQEQVRESSKGNESLVEEDDDRGAMFMEDEERFIGGANDDNKVIDREGPDVVKKLASKVVEKVGGVLKDVQGYGSGDEIEER